jgi:ATP-dependent exoDNAse (exonuclease V) beta subunit
VYCERPILISSDGEERTAIRDRLVVMDEKVVVVDYKSHHPAEKVLEEYKKQVEFYTEIAKKLFGKELAEGYLLFLLPSPKVEKVV